jgi:hypothetical protein
VPAAASAPLLTANSTLNASRRGCSARVAFIRILPLCYSLVTLSTATPADNMQRTRQYVVRH